MYFQVLKPLCAFVDMCHKICTEDFGEKILEVRYRPFGLFDVFSVIIFSAIALLFTYIALTKPNETFMEFLVVLVFALGLWGAACSILFMNRAKPVYVVFENGLHSNKFKLGQVKFIHWNNILDVSVRLNFVNLVPSQNADFSEKNNYTHRSHSLLYGGGEQNPIMLRFHGSYGMDLYDIDVQSFAEVCNSALNEYRKKNALE